MRVALVAPFVAAIDDRAGQIGGAQSVIADLAAGLVRRGHDVTLLAPRGSRVQGVRVVDLDFAPDPHAALDPSGPSASGGSQADAFAAVARWLSSEGRDLDIVHGHAFDAPAFHALRGRRAMHTLHLPPFDAAVVSAAQLADATLATVSESCRSEWRSAGVEVSEILPNGIDLDAIPVGAGAGGYVAFAGRLSSEKGVDVACRVARTLGLPLRIAGPRYDGAYFDREVAPLLGGGIRYVGPLDRAALWSLLGDAAVTLLPVRWNEPFGMVALESMACGTPVVAYARGGLREVVIDGRSGRLVAPGDEAQFAEAVAGATEIARSSCRADAARYDLERMLDAHEALYRRITAG